MFKSRKDWRTCSRPMGVRELATKWLHLHGQLLFFAFSSNSRRSEALSRRLRETETDDATTPKSCRAWHTFHLYSWSSRPWCADVAKDSTDKLLDIRHSKRYPWGDPCNQSLSHAPF